MAASLLNHSQLVPHSSAYSLKHSKDTKSASIRVQSLYQKSRFSKPVYGFSSSLPFAMNGKSCPRTSTFKASLSAQESTRTENVKTSGGENWPGSKAMIRVYREALLNGDDRNISEIESRIRFIENEKNALEKQVLELSAQIASEKVNVIRKQADFNNFRHRWEKEKLSTWSDAKGEVMESLLPMVDSFERVKHQIKPDTEKEKNIDASYQGIYKQFVEIMRSLQVAVVPTVGKPFDPFGVSSAAEPKNGLGMKSRDIDGLTFSAPSKRKSEEESSSATAFKFVMGVALVSVIVGFILGKRFSVRHQ